MQLTARSAGGLLGSARPSSAPLGSARSSPTSPLTPAMPPLERTVSAAAALTQPADSPCRRAAAPTPPTQQHSMAWQVTPRQQMRTEKASKIPSSPFAASIIADSRSLSAETPLLHTSCATVPERSDEADQDSSPGQKSQDDAQSRPPNLAVPAQASSVPPLRLENLAPSSEKESSGSDADSDAASGRQAAAEAPEGDTAGNACNGVLALHAAGIELTGDADEDVRRMLAQEGYESDSSSYSSDDGRCDPLACSA